MNSSTQAESFRQRIMDSEPPLSGRVRLLFAVLIALPFIGALIQWEVDRSHAGLRSAERQFQQACTDQRGVLLRTWEGHPLCANPDRSHLRLLKIDR